jgi:phosphoenolpyruvate carboxylase
LAAWYGFGSSCERFVQGADSSKEGIKERLAQLREAYKSWNLFSTLVDNIEMSIAKTDDRIALKYLGLSNRSDLSEKVINELKLTNDWVMRINGSSYPLQNRRVLGRAVQIRGPYVDALSLLQVFALRRLRLEQEQMTQKEIAEYQYLLLCTVSGVAAGLQNTG